MKERSIKWIDNAPKVANNDDFDTAFPADGETQIHWCNWENPQNYTNRTMSLVLVMHH